MKPLLLSACAAFEARYGRPAQWGAFAPGRVNLIGEHIDYCGGPVLPAALDQGVAVSAAPSQDGFFRLWSEQYAREFAWDAQFWPEAPSPQRWPNYFLAVLEQFRCRGQEVPPIWTTIVGDVPAGAGLSSSAAFEVAATYLSDLILRTGLGATEKALLAQSAEHSDWVGVQCGIMDQFVAAHATANQALLLNCDTLKHHFIPINSEVFGWLIIHSTVERSLTTSAYNERREQCESALRILDVDAGTPHAHLSAVPLEELERHRDRLPKTVRRRARHVITETARVHRFAAALEADDASSAGRILNESHRSLRDDFEVSCPELDALQHWAEQTDGIHGCRMTGAGFGGCIVALVEPTRLSTAADVITARAESEWGTRPWALVTQAGGGAETWEA